MTDMTMEKGRELIDRAVEGLQTDYPEGSLTVSEMPTNERVVSLPANALHRVVETLVERFEIHHLSTITGQDTGEAIELLYHFWHGAGLTLRVRLNRDAASVDSVTDLIPGALFYEREVSEMLGVTLKDLPDPRALLLPDEWDEPPPLRKSGGE